MMFKILTAFFLLTLSAQALSSYGQARRLYEAQKLRDPQKLFIELVDAKLYFSALPLAKEILVKSAGRFSGKSDQAFSELIQVVGVKQFETLPQSYLGRTNSSDLKYIMAKKAFRDGKNSSAIRYLLGINSSDIVYPYAKQMQATIYSIEGKQETAFDAFDKCEKSSNSKIGSASRRDSARLKLNRDLCIVGKARVRFAQKSYDDSDLLYLDLPKSSKVWPEILYEEGWNSYYQQNYNRTLGKLVSYKAPVFDYFFNPEVDVLQALSYMKLCLYGDAQKIVDDFYARYYRDTKYLRRLIQKLGKDYKKYFALVNRYERFGKAPNNLIEKQIKNILNEVVYLDLKHQMILNVRELNRIRDNRKGSFNTFLYNSAQESLASYQSLMGNYIRSKFVSYYAQLYKAFEGMSYIKLEVLSQQKAKLYSFEEKSRSRGDVKYIKRNDKQYFWDFNGEFWADELGDYVFGLKSEC